MRPHQLTTWCLAGALLAATGASAQPPAPGLVVRGRVVDARAQWDATRTIHTYVTIDVSAVVVGSAVPARIVLKQLGGRVGELGLWVAGQTTFAPDEDVLLDLEVAPLDGTLRTRGLARGKWRLDARGATTRVDAFGVQHVPYDELRVTLARTRVAAPGFVAVPTEVGAPQRLSEAAFSFLPTGGPPPRWHEVDAGSPVFVDHPSSLPGGWPAAASDVGDAVARWRASGMDLDLRDGGASLPAGQCPATTFSGSGRIAVAYNDPCGSVGDWVVGGGYYTTADLRVVNGQTFQKFVQGFLILNETGPHTTSAGCFRDALTHGLGHALGLGHSAADGAMMQAGPPATCPTGGSALAADDVTGITTIYEGIPAAAAPPDPPTAMTASAVLSTVTLGWTPATTGGAVQRFVLDAGTAPGVYNLGAVAVTAPATSTSVAGVPPGTYYVRARAQNPLGTSGPSPEATVTVGACAVPGPPASFSAAASDTAVSLQWSAPAAGVAQGYLLTAGTAPGLSNLASIPLPATPTTLTAAVPYGRYYVRLHATNVCGVSGASTEALLDVVPCAVAPSAPSDLVAGVSGGTVSLQWAAPASGPAPTGYTLRVGSVPGGSDVLVYPTRSVATTLGAPAPRGTYYVRVVATNACGASAESNQIAVVVP